MHNDDKNTGHPHGAGGHPHGAGGHPHGAGGHPHGDSNNVTTMQSEETNGEFTAFRTSQKNSGSIESFFAHVTDTPLYDAFDKKVVLHPGMGGRPVRENQEQVIASLLEKPRTSTSIAYIHVPFCETHCIYCGFYNKAYKKESSKEYTDALIKELALWAETPFQQNYPIHALYFGGGTPSALEAEDLSRIFEAVHRYLPLANDCEITFETRTYNFTEAKQDACFQGGVNRFSLGVQSFNTELRRSMGRKHSQEELLAVIQALQSRNNAAIVYDLIYGFPNQSMAMWDEDLSITKSLRVDGVDCYQLKVFRDSLLDKAIGKGMFPPQPSLKEQARFYEKQYDFFTKACYTSISSEHWARTCRERNIYNQYARTADHMLSFGPGAGGTIHGMMYFINNNYEAWLHAIEQGQKPIAMLVAPQQNHALSKALTLSLYHGSLDCTALEETLDYPIRTHIQPLLDQWEEAGLLTQDAGTIYLTMPGKFWQVNICQYLIDYTSYIIQE